MQESGENYLETILLLSKKGGEVHSIDIAREMNFSKPSVSRAMKILKETGFIEVQQGGAIHLTEKGKKKSEDILERHGILTEFLIKTAGVSAKVAEENACRMEHIISQDVFEGIKKFISTSH